MHLLQYSILARLSVSVLLVLPCYTSPAPFPLRFYGTVHDSAPSTYDVVISRSGTPRLPRSIDSSLPPRIATRLEDDRLRSLMPLPTRDLTTLKDNLRLVLEHILPFENSDEAIPVMLNLLTQSMEAIKKLSYQQLAKRTFSVSYGSFKMTFRFTGDIVLDYIGEILKSLHEKVKAGMAGFFEITTSKGGQTLGSVLLTLITFGGLHNG